MKIMIFFLLLTLFLLPITFQSIIYAESEIEISPTDDAYVITDLNDPQDLHHLRSFNTGNLEFLKVWYALDVTENHDQIISPAVLKFNLSPLDEYDVKSAVLRLYVEDLVLPSGSNNISVYSTQNTQWQEDKITYDTSPLFQNVISRANIDSVGWYEWNIPTNLFESPENNISFTLAFENMTRNTEEIVTFSSKEGLEENIPKLLVQTFPRMEHISSDTDKLYPIDDAYVITDVTDPQDLKNYQKINTGFLDFIRLSYALNVDPEQSQLLTMGYLKFDLSEINKEKIQNITLKMKSINIQKLQDTIGVDVAHVTQSSWSESDLIFSSRPLPTLDSLVSTEISEPESWNSWDVTNFITDDDSVSLALGLSKMNTNSEELVSFYSKENRENSPYLEIKYTEPINDNGGGCLIATATYGSELAPQVQQLRELRDNYLLQTQSGHSFMTTFNQFYYSFSPIISDLERENPIFKELVRLSITPLISSLSLLNYADLNSESSVLGYGISIITLNIGMYFVSPVIGFKITRTLFFTKKEGSFL